MLLFLDIDGVMVPQKSWKSPEFLGDGFPAFSIRAIRTLQILVTPDDTIVLTTSHKSRYSVEVWKGIFLNRGIQIGKITALPENVNHLSRREEIYNWFKANVVNEHFIILDDDKSLNDLPNSLKRNLVQTTSQIGLTEEHLSAIESIVQRQIQAS